MATINPNAITDIGLAERLRDEAIQKLNNQPDVTQPILTPPAPVTLPQTSSGIGGRGAVFNNFMNTLTNALKPAPTQVSMPAVATPGLQLETKQQVEEQFMQNQIAQAEFESREAERQATQQFRQQQLDMQQQGLEMERVNFQANQQQQAFANQLAVREYSDSRADAEYNKIRDNATFYQGIINEHNAQVHRDNMLSARLQEVSNNRWYQEQRLEADAAQRRVDNYNNFRESVFARLDKRKEQERSRYDYIGDDPDTGLPRFHDKDTGRTVTSLMGGDHSSMLDRKIEREASRLRKADPLLSPFEAHETAAQYLYQDAMRDSILKEARGKKMGEGDVVFHLNPQNPLQVHWYELKEEVPEGASLEDHATFRGVVNQAQLQDPMLRHYLADLMDTAAAGISGGVTVQTPDTPVGPAAMRPEGGRTEAVQENINQQLLSPDPTEGDVAAGLTPMTPEELRSKRELRERLVVDNRMDRKAVQAMGITPELYNEANGFDPSTKEAIRQTYATIEKVKDKRDELEDILETPDILMFAESNKFVPTQVKIRDDIIRQMAKYFIKRLDDKEAVLDNTP